MRQTVILSFVVRLTDIAFCRAIRIAGRYAHPTNNWNLIDSKRAWDFIKIEFNHDSEIQIESVTAEYHLIDRDALPNIWAMDFDIMIVDEQTRRRVNFRFLVEDR